MVIFTLARTTERPVYSMQTQDVLLFRRCEIKHAHKLIYNSTFQKPADDAFSKIGIIVIYVCGAIVLNGHMIHYLPNSPPIPAGVVKPVMRVE